MIESILRQRTVEASEVVLSGLRPVTEALARTGVIFLSHQGGKFRRIRHIALAVIDEMIVDKEKDTGKHIYGN